MKCEHLLLILKASIVCTVRVYSTLYLVWLVHRLYISGGSRISRRGGVDPLGGPGPPMQVLFSENVCENERTGSHRGGHAPLDLPMYMLSQLHPYWLRLHVAWTKD